METPTKCVSCFLNVIEKDILPKTKEGVAKGNKIFGAAILKKSDLSVVIAETNNELENPLWHGEMHALKKFYELPSRPDTKDCLFLSTHEPCSLCLSAITWSGFDNFYYFFSYENSRDAFNIPHDLKILKEVFKLPNGEYARENEFWKCSSIQELIEQCEDKDPSWEAQIAAIRRIYDDISQSYQSEKADNGIPLN